MRLADFCARLLRERLQQLGFDLDLPGVVLQFWTLQQESIFDPLAQRADFCELHAQMVLRKDACHQVQQAGPVAGGNTEEPSLRFLVWL